MEPDRAEGLEIRQDSWESLSECCSGTCGCWFQGDKLYSSNISYWDVNSHEIFLDCGRISFFIMKKKIP